MREGWRTVCDGRKFWSPHFDVPRKCTQSVVAMNASRTEVRKTCRDARAFENEARALARLDAGDGAAPFPRLLRSDRDSRTLVMRHCGEPVTPRAIPPSCRRQVRALGAALRAARVLHGDVLPHNFLQADGTLRLIDFGRARVLARADGDAELQRQHRAFDAVADQLCDPVALGEYLAKQLPEARAPARAATTRKRARHEARRPPIS